MKLNATLWARRLASSLPDALFGHRRVWPRRATARSRSAEPVAHRGLVIGSATSPPGPPPRRCVTPRPRASNALSVSPGRPPVACPTGGRQRAVPCCVVRLPLRARGRRAPSPSVRTVALPAILAGVQAWSGTRRRHGHHGRRPVAFDRSELSRIRVSPRPTDFVSAALPFCGEHRRGGVRRHRVGRLVEQRARVLVDLGRPSPTFVPTDVQTCGPVPWCSAATTTARCGALSRDRRILAGRRGERPVADHRAVP